MRVKLEYINNYFLEFEKHHCQYIVGSNSKIKEQIFSSCQYFNKKRKMMVEESILYGDDGLTFYIDDKLLTTKNSYIFTISSIQDLLDELTLKKGTLMSYYLSQQLEQNFELQKQYEVLKNNILILENLLSQSLVNDDLINMSYSYPIAGLHELLNKGVIEYNISNIYQSEYERMMDNFIQLITILLKNDAKPILLVMRHFSDFLNLKYSSNLFHILESLASQYSNFIPILINDGEYLTLSTSDIESVIYVNSYEIQQLPPFDILKKSIMMHYPIEYRKDDEVLMVEINRYLPRLSLECYSRDMIICNVLRELLER